MQIVIDIPKVLYERIKNAELVIANMGRGNRKSSSTTDLSIILNVIQRGTPLNEWCLTCMFMEDKKSEVEE